MKASSYPPYDNYGGLTWSQPYYSPLSGMTVSFTCPVTNKKGDHLGVLIVELDMSDIKNDLDRILLKKGQTYVLMTSEENIVAFGRNADLLTFIIVYRKLE